MQLQLTDSQDCDLAVSVKDRKGNPASVQDPTWASSDSGVLALQVDPSDPLKATISAVGPTGAALVTFQGDADLGEGVMPIVGTLDVVVIAGQATVIEIAAGAPREQA